MQAFVINVEKILEEGISLKTSGSTGIAKAIYQDPKKIRSANAVARKVQKINAKSKILTVCSLRHAGGLLAQTLPGLEIGAYVEIYWIAGCVMRTLEVVMRMPKIVELNLEKLD